MASNKENMGTGRSKTQGCCFKQWLKVVNATLSTFQHYKALDEGQGENGSLTLDKGIRKSSLYERMTLVSSTTNTT